MKIRLLILFITLLKSISAYCQNETNLCDKVETRKDKFNGNEISIPPISGGVAFMKVKRGNDISIYLSIINIGNSVSVDKSGVIVLFDDGSKFEKKEEKVDVRVNEKAEYEYNSLIKLTEDDLVMFLNKNITDTRLYIYDFSLNKEQSFNAKEYLKCITNNK